MFLEADAKIKAKEDTEIGGYLPYSNAMLEIGENHLEMAKRVLEEPESNPNKAGFVKSRNALAHELIEMASEFAEIETPTHDNLILYAPTEQVSLSDGVPGSVIFSLYNYDDLALDGARLRVTDAQGTTLAETEVSVDGGESITVLLNMTANSETLSGGYGYAYLTLGDKTLQRVSVKLLT